MTEPVTIGIGANKWVKESATKMITLHLPSTSGTLSLHDDSGVDYQVPVGKKFIILGVYTSSGALTSTATGTQGYVIGIDLYKNTTTDSISGGTKILSNNSIQMKFMRYDNPTLQALPVVPKIDTFIEIAVSNYVVCLVKTGGYTSCNVIGIETDV
jgi:hypothetical protein